MAQISARHVLAYLDEICFRFNNRKNDFIFRDTMLKLIGSPNLEYRTDCENRRSGLILFGHQKKPLVCGMIHEVVRVEKERPYYISSI